MHDNAIFNLIELTSGPAGPPESPMVPCTQLPGPAEISDTVKHIAKNYSRGVSCLNETYVGKWVQEMYGEETYNILAAITKPKFSGLKPYRKHPLIVYIGRKMSACNFHYIK